MFRSRPVRIIFNAVAFSSVLTSVAIIVALLLNDLDVAMYEGAALGCLVSLVAVIGCVAKKG